MLAHVIGILITLHCHHVGAVFARIVHERRHVGALGIVRVAPVDQDVTTGTVLAVELIEVLTQLVIDRRRVRKPVYL